MKKRVASRVLIALRGHRLTVCVAASSVLALPLLVIPPGGGDTPDDRSLQHDFQAAAKEYHVPQSVLLGVSYLQSRWDTHSGAPSVAGGYGPMHLVDGARMPPAASSGPPPTEEQNLAGPPPRAPLPMSRPSLQPAELRRAARLIGAPAERVRTDPGANVRGGAAVLAATQRELGKPLSDNPADWWEAVARFPGSTDAATATTFANDVFALIRKGAQRTTEEGQHVTLTAQPSVRPRPQQAPKDPDRPQQVECPQEVTCSWLSAPYVQFDDEYGNHDLADRPRDEKIEYIVIHDTEASLDSMLKTIQDPTEASWHYSVRSSDGHITQHIRTKDEAWHSGSKFVNARSIGIEHEGFLTQPDAWYTEEMYRSSARLVRYLATKYGIPLDRQHIFGHDNVPAPTGDTIPDMHDDPGPYWDWRHYFDLLGAPLKATAGADSAMVTILTDYATHRPTYTGCTGDGLPCASHGSSAVRLHTEPRESAPLIQDRGRRPDGESSTTDVNDLGSRVSSGQTYAVAGRQGDWTAIWYLGHKAWFKNPKSHPTAVGAAGKMVTPKDGLTEIPVYGRALPEGDAYPAGIEKATEAPLPYTIDAGQRYVTQARLTGSYTDRSTFAYSPSPVVKGSEEYYEIQFGHRLAYVRAGDVVVINAPGTPPDQPTQPQPK
ncbi:N-acetylmuramoyl-L-alanine amidase [Streptomyces sp. NPDC004629]|uniref:N-acetylmuramoyl-L-alanine amidase n=1 Tax=Streptomyces sp. NPDC004629 TaxID=3364705 RepID=UPI0036B7A5B3